jgi:hypothetical protein
MVVVARQPVLRPAGCPAGFLEGPSCEAHQPSHLVHRAGGLAPDKAIGLKYPMRVWQYYDDHLQRAQSSVDSPPVIAYSYRFFPPGGPRQPAGVTQVPSVVSYQNAGRWRLTGLARVSSRHTDRRRNCALVRLSSSPGAHSGARVVRDEHDQIVAQLKKWIANPDIEVSRRSRDGWARALRGGEIVVSA